MGRESANSQGWPRPLKGLLLWALLCAVLGTLAFQGTRGLYESTEGRYAECAQEMLVTGDFLRPTLDYAPHWTKPPLAYWAVAVGVKLFGRNAWGARAYLVPTFVLTVCAVYWLARWLWNPGVGTVSALVFATLWGPMGAANTVNTDSLLTLWETWALACFWWGVRTRRVGPIVLMWWFFGMAFLTKGPPGLLPLLALIVFRMLSQDQEVRGVRLWVPAGIGLGLVTALWWYVWAVAHYPGLTSYWLKHEVIGRVATDEFKRHSRWYEMFTVYWPFLLGGALPWLGLVLWIERHRIGVWFRRRRSEGEQGTLDGIKACWKNLSTEARFVVFALLIPLSVFSLSRSRLPLYVLPLFPILACAIGWKIRNFIDQGLLTPKRFMALALAGTVVIVFGKGIMATWSSKKDMGTLARALEAAWPESEGVRNQPLYVYSKRPLHGLHFYWGDPFIRVYSKFNKPTPPGYFPPSVLTDHQASGMWHPSMQKHVLTPRETEPYLRGWLCQQGYQGSTKSLTPHWILLVVTPGPCGVTS
ncbi:ArnT family glycosyltransferase [Desulfosoma caldarium]|uniref:4-amino-4-deoxy-L-arabinose transferase n=1 Tax=Desulfosoma caldarium TaxID=610254 RepID=A0A3N1UNY8_9BACT|nr:glycosyltransferase family 39 protein [Desulfosoma caldarium]ROQ89581.1 4-amino-4-deoxy-L-arabinose transferase [Desulfosoma caldarium]